MKKFFTLPTFILTGILLVASFLRLYMIEAYLTFLGDEGRDVLVALHILRGDFTLLGPRASAGDFFLGPIYYYLITPFLWIFNYNPVGPAILVALIGIATVALVYYIAKRFFGTYPALAAASLYAISPLVVEYSRSSWNPNPMPFVSLLTLYILYLGIKDHSWKKFVIVGFLLGIAMQLHYLATFLGVIIAVFVVVGNIVVKRSLLSEVRHMMFQYFQILVGFLIGFSPFLTFEARHNFPNIRTIFTFIFVNTFEKGYESTGASFLNVVANVAFRTFGRVLTAFPPENMFNWYTSNELLVWQWGTIALAILLTLSLLRVKNILTASFLAIWLILGIGLFGFYKKPIYDYYLGFLYPLPFLLFANFLQVLSAKKIKWLTKKVGVVVGVTTFSLLIFSNLIYNPLSKTPNHQKDQMKKIAEFVLDKTYNQPYNFALLSKGNTDHAYRYFFELDNMPPVAILNNISDPQRNSVTDQLFVVCEQECSPLGNPLWEIAGFGRAEISDEWGVSNTKIYRLVHFSSEESK